MRTARKLLIASALAALVAAPSAPAHAVDFGGLAKKAAKAGSEAGGSAARDQVVKEVNAKLLAEGRKNQCSFKTDSDELAPGCDAKVRRLTNALVAAKERLKVAHITDYKFEVSGHTDTRGKADHNKELSKKRAAVIVRELTAKGIPESEIIAVGMGSEHPLVANDDTPAKQAKNRRYEIQLRF